MSVRIIAHTVNRAVGVLLTLPGDVIVVMFLFRKVLYRWDDTMQ